MVNQRLVKLVAGATLISGLLYGCDSTNIGSKNGYSCTRDIWGALTIKKDGEYVKYFPDVASRSEIYFEGVTRENVMGIIQECEEALATLPKK